ncbi:hypothetical protein E2320_006921, partial [Naja naja]
SSLGARNTLEILLGELSKDFLTRPLTRNEACLVLLRVAIFGATTYFSIKWVSDALDPAQKQRMQLKKRVTWNDVAGLNELVSELRDAVILPLQQTRLFKHSKLCQPPKGVLLYGPPGCGKTLLAKAMAQASNCRFINLQAPTLMDRWNRSRTDHEATAMMKAEFMSLWDGLQTASDCQTQRQRQEILKLILAGENMSNAVSLKELAEKTHGYSGSDLWELCRDAATYRVRDYVRKQQMRQIARLLHRRGSVEETDLEENPLRPLTQLDLLLALEKMKESRGA